ncbi:MAG: alpha/beta fold hydrolase [Caulobacteraceae bacterium]
MKEEAAPLVATAEAPVPVGMRAFWHEGSGGARLRAAIAPSDGPARGGVVLSPGRTEPIEKYFEVIGELQARGFWVLAHDWRGQGLSHRPLPDRLKGHAAGHGDFLDDFGRLLDWAEPQLPRPWITLGHSMGGTLAAMALAAGERRFSGAFLSAPMMGLAAARRLPLPAARLIARGMLRAGRAEEFVLKDGFEPMLGPFESNILTHDARRYERYRDQLRACPELALGGVTWGWLAFALDCAAEMDRSGAARAAGLPLTVLTAGEDQLVLNAPARRYAERAPQGRYAEIAGAYHEVLMETDARRALVWREFDALAERVG